MTIADRRQRNGRLLLGRRLRRHDSAPLGLSLSRPRQVKMSEVVVRNRRRRQRASQRRDNKFDDDDDDDDIFVDGRT